MSTFCRHNRFTADCPICSKGTVLESGGQRGTRRKASAAARKRSAGEKGSTPAFSGPHVAGPARRDADDALYLIRLERVPGGVRLGEWRGSALAPRAPVLPADDLADLVARSADALQPRDAAKMKAALETAAVREAVGEADREAGGDAGRDAGDKAEREALDEGEREGGSYADRHAGKAGVSRGRSGDFKEELRIEALGDGQLRVARWVLRPVIGWELQDAPPMLPAARYAEALADAARRGLIAPASSPAASSPNAPSADASLPALPSP